MICPNCGHQNRQSAKFCEECGIVLPSTLAGTSNAATPLATPRAQSAIPRRFEPFHAGSSSAATSEAQPSGTTMLDTMDSGRTRRIFGLIALALVFLLCCCCGLAIVAFYWLTQNQGASPMGLM